MACRFHADASALKEVRFISSFISLKSCFGGGLEQGCRCRRDAPRVRGVCGRCAYGTVLNVKKKAAQLCQTLAVHSFPSGGTASDVRSISIKGDIRVVPELFEQDCGVVHVRLLHAEPLRHRRPEIHVPGLEPLNRDAHCRGWGLSETLRFSKIMSD